MLNRCRAFKVLPRVRIPPSPPLLRASRSLGQFGRASVARPSLDARPSGIESLPHRQPSLISHAKVAHRSATREGGPPRVRFGATVGKPRISAARYDRRFAWNCPSWLNFRIQTCWLRSSVRDSRATGRIGVADSKVAPQRQSSLTHSWTCASPPARAPQSGARHV